MGMTPGEKKAYNQGFEAGANSVEEGLPGWFGTFADMMTLLFAFFCPFGSYFNNGSGQIAGNGKLSRKITGE